MVKSKNNTVDISAYDPRKPKQRFSESPFSMGITEEKAKTKGYLTDAKVELNEKSKYAETQTQQVFIPIERVKDTTGFIKLYMLGIVAFSRIANSKHPTAGYKILGLLFFIASQAENKQLDQIEITMKWARLYNHVMECYDTKHKGVTPKTTEITKNDLTLGKQALLQVGIIACDEDTGVYWFDPKALFNGQKISPYSQEIYRESKKYKTKVCGELPKVTVSSFDRIKDNENFDKAIAELEPPIEDAEVIDEELEKKIQDAKKIIDEELEQERARIFVQEEKEPDVDIPPPDIENGILFEDDELLEINDKTIKKSKRDRKALEEFNKVVEEKLDKFNKVRAKLREEHKKIKNIGDETNDSNLNV